MTKFNPQNYEFIWLVKNQTFFDTSWWLNRNYLERDFIATFQNDEFKMYLDKDERSRLNDFGIEFLSHDLEKFIMESEKIYDRAKEYYRKIRQKDISKLSDDKLSGDLLDVGRHANKVIEQYFFTEFFLYDRAQQMAESQHKKNGFAAKLKRLGEVKLKLREVALNETQFFGNVFEKYLSEAQTRTKRKDLKNLSYEEIAELLKGNFSKSVDRSTYVLGHFNGWKTLTGNEADKMISQLERNMNDLESDARLSKILMGQVASKGRTVGRVKIIPFDLNMDYLKEIAQMKNGDVLVSGSTGPELVPACRKASAIITEEGGILSHAAIISRELKIPCIVGTKIATKVLKDGDLVEVDANKGMVRKIK